MIRDYWNEKWKDVVFDESISEKEKFKISNRGRIINCKHKKEFLAKQTIVNGYHTLALTKKNGKNTRKYSHKLVAEHFLENKNNGSYVIHLNYDKTDNRAENLKWATKEEKEEHQFKNNPNWKKKRKKLKPNSKLTETKVKLIKRKINDPKRKTRMKIIAKQFGISEMQLYRIKSGENWGSVTE